MKRMIPILLALVMTAAMTACKNQGGPLVRKQHAIRQRKRTGIGVRE